MASRPAGGGSTPGRRRARASARAPRARGPGRTAADRPVGAPLLRTIVGALWRRAEPAQPAARREPPGDRPVVGLDGDRLVDHLLVEDDRHDRRVRALEGAV